MKLQPISVNTEDKTYFLSYGNHIRRSKRDHIWQSCHFETEEKALQKAHRLRFIQGYCVVVHSGFILGRSATGQPTSWSQDTSKVFCSERSPASCWVAHPWQ